MSTSGYESWFVSARDPASARALWIRHTSLRSRQGPQSTALWCAVVDRGLDQRPVLIKQVFSAFPPSAAAGAGQFRGQAAMAGQDAQWELALTGGQPPVRPLRPAVLYRAPLPRTKLEAGVPDGLVTGMLEVNGHRIGVDRWRGTVGHNWGTEHADRWVWLHAAGFGAVKRLDAGPLLRPTIADMGQDQQDARWEAFVTAMLALGPAVECRSRFADKPALACGSREIAHLEAAGVIDLRITRAGWAQLRDDFGQDPAVRHDRSRRDWIELHLRSVADLHRLSRLLAVAMAANA